MKYDGLLKRGMLVLAAAAVAVAAGGVPGADAQGKKVQPEAAATPVAQATASLTRE